MLRTFLITCCIALCCSTAVADDEGSFPKGTFTLHSYTAFAGNLHGNQELIPSVTVGCAYYVDRSFALGAEVSGLFFDQGEDSKDAAGAALSLLLRHHFIDTDAYTMYFELSSGPLIATHAVPGDGTHFNFMTRLGLGVTIPMSAQADLNTGLRFTHISNARTHGKDENPGIDGLQAYVGLIWRR